jgi:hypothetical protein
MAKVAGREVSMFRCHIDPMIGPSAKQAFIPKDSGMKAVVNDECSGIVVTYRPRTGEVQEHFVAFTNIQAMRLEPETAEVIELRKKK